VLEWKEVSVRYGKRQVLRGLSLGLERGVIHAVIGRNGAGKSTALKAAAGILPLSSGEIFIDGAPRSAMTGREAAAKIAYLPQGQSVPQMTVFRLVLLGRYPRLPFPYRAGEKDVRLAEEAMERMGISHLREEEVSSLSGGMRQRAFLAMALCRDADYILLDEPTTYLDFSHQLELMKTLRELADGGKGICAVLHDLPMAFTFSDRISILDDGGTAAEGHPMELAASGKTEEILGVSLRVDPNGGFGYRF